MLSQNVIQATTLATCKHINLKAILNLRLIERFNHST